MNKEYEMFGKKLYELRTRKGYTQTKLAQIAGVSQRVVEYYEKYAKRPSIDKVKKLAAALGVSDEELLGVRFLKPDKEEIPYKIMKKVRVIQKLPTRDQNAIFNLINALAEKNKSKGKL
jgi:transcriptional regulator with XRE-family HTH domain